MGGEASVFGFEILPRTSERLRIQQPGWSIAHRQGWVYVISRQGSQNGNSCHYCPERSYVLSDIDFYDCEYQQFQWDVHILISGTLDAGIRYLNTEARAELSKIEEGVKKSTDNEVTEYLVD